MAYCSVHQIIILGSIIIVVPYDFELGLGNVMHELIVKVSLTSLAEVVEGQS